MKTCGFMSGFLKRAADAEKGKKPAPAAEEAAPSPEEAPVDPAAGQVRAPLSPQPIEKLLKWDALGGLAPRTPEDMQAATAVDLITLPADVDGANCGNCMHARILDEAIGHGFCTHPEVKQDVTPRMICARWEHPGQIRSWEQEDAAAVPHPGIMQEAEQVAQGEMPFDPELAALPGELPLEQGAPDASGEAGAGGDAAANGGKQTDEPDAEDANAKSEPAQGEGGEKKEPKAKKPGGDKHTINIHVGGEKKASAFFRGFGK